jgi:hypothetical protein
MYCSDSYGVTSIEMVYTRFLFIVFLVNQTAMVVAAAGELTISRERTAFYGKIGSGQHATNAAGNSLVAPLDRIATAVDGAESSYGNDSRMWRPDLSGPQGPMQISGAAASDVGGGDRFDLTQNRVIGRAYLARLYGRYKNWPDAIAAYNWGLSNVDSWIRAGRPSKKLLAGVAAYTTRVLRNSGLCYVIDPKQLQGPAIFGDDPQVRTVADRSAQPRLARSNADGARSTGNERYFCGAAPNGRSKVSQARLYGGARPSQSLLERLTASARSSWKAAMQGQ